MQSVAVERQMLSSWDVYEVQYTRESPVFWGEGWEGTIHMHAHTWMQPQIYYQYI